MSNVVTLYADKRWKAVSEYRSDEGPEVVEYYFEEISDLHMIVEHGRDWNSSDSLYDHAQQIGQWRGAE